MSKMGKYADYLSHNSPGASSFPAPESHPHRAQTAKVTNDCKWL